MLVFKRLSCFLATLLCLFAAPAYAQMKNYDQKCLDDAGKRYINCMANSGTNEVRKNECQKTLAEERKQCVKK